MSNLFVISSTEVCTNDHASGNYYDDLRNFSDNDFIEISCVVDGDILDRENLLLAELNKALAEWS